ncbi:putative quinol monooxygenase [Mycobacterium paraffinicum]|uniref:Antibiotic biosynthesis monooxygenase n=1 Tax=Mycobacterium paraffinicum TaxID=53378 RepID=A0ABP8F7A5_9MYCO|nr:antibiotic biosynthesis monooxygenase [Mycobacterium paraffinicum]
MDVTRGLLALLEAKPGKGDALSTFLAAGRATAVAEEETVTWYAFRLSDTTFGIFDTFAAEDGRQAHLNGQIPVELGKVSDDLLAKKPDIRPGRHHRGQVADGGESVDSGARGDAGGGIALDNGATQLR